MQTELNQLSKQGQWEAMGDVVTDEVLETFAVVGEPAEIPKLMLARYGDVIDRISLYAPYQGNAEQWAQILAGFHAG
jgi:hypothetical protein